MQSDEVIWQVIGNHFCAYKIKAPDSGKNFCRNEYNLTGLCNRRFCPLANSQYATVREHKGICYLYMKTVERSHLPAQLWEKIKLPNNFEQGIAEIEKHLEFWPKYLQVKCKQRLKRLFQYLSKVRKLRLSDKSGQLSVFKQKTERRETRREKKAEVVAKLDSSIEKELVARLKSGLYQDIYNIAQEPFETVLKREFEAVSDDEEQVEFVPGSDLEFESETEDELEYDEELEDKGELEEEFYETDEEVEELRVEPHTRKSKGQSHVLIEYEQEQEPETPLLH